MSSPADGARSRQALASARVTVGYVRASALRAGIAQMIPKDGAYRCRSFTVAQKLRCAFQLIVSAECSLEKL